MSIYVQVIHNVKIILSDYAIKNDMRMTMWISRKFDMVSRSESGPRDGRRKRGRAINKAAFVCERRISDDYRSHARVIFT